MSTNGANFSKPHAAFLASPGMGHLIPIVELAKQFIKRNFTITLILAPSGSSLSASKLLETTTRNLPPNLISIITLPSVDVPARREPKSTLFKQQATMMRESMPSLRSVLAAMERPPSVLVVDMFGTEALKIANEFSMLKYVLFTSHAWYFAQAVYATAVLREEVRPGEVLKIPGCKEVRYEDLANPIYAWGTEDYEFYVGMGREMSTNADGVLVNTWHGLERATLDALKSNEKLRKHCRTPVFAIGPIVRPAESSIHQTPRNELLVWLDQQPSESVVYVSFGSGGTLSSQQTMELARGLELSEQRFIWVIRRPIENDACASLFVSSNGDSDTSSGWSLPEGFLTRTRKIGRVVSVWAPQTDILSHSSVGGFLTHCGWNSSLESMINGVPMIAWPLYAEQRMNATLLAEDAKVAVRAEAVAAKDVIGREEISKMVRKVMVEEEGIGIRSRVKELQRSAQTALSKKGSSYDSLCRVFEAACNINYVVRVKQNHPSQDVEAIVREMNVVS